MMNNLLCKTFVMGALICSTQLSAQKVSDKQPWSVRMVESEMIRCPESWQLDFQPKLKWDYCHGLELQAMLDVYDTYGDKKIFDYALAYADTMIHNDGSIETYKLHEYNIDRLNSGKFLFRIYEQTKDEKYKKAIDLLRSQLDTHPRNEDGGFWHKKVYPNQMWLDGIYMGAPFYAEYAFRNNRVQDYQDIVNQFITVARHTYDPKNGLYRHACDVSRKERWADPVTGQSQHSWGRAMGWYAMAMVDVMEVLPECYIEERKAALKLFADGMLKYQDESGLWANLADQPVTETNRLEVSGTAMMIYMLLKGVRKSWLNESYREPAIKAFNAIVNTKLHDNILEDIYLKASANNTNNYEIPEYYLPDEGKGSGPFIMAYSEMLYL